MNKRSRAAIRHDTVKFWKSATDTVAEGKKISAVQEIGLSPELKVVNFKGISEAMINCVQHAYDSLEGAEPRWWMFSEERDGMRTVAVCDLGAGIPTTLKENPELGTILAQLGLNNDDAAVIKAAFEDGVSRTGLPNRGKGLHDVRKDIETQNDAYLVALSGYGLYRYTVKDNVEAMSNFRDSLPGTLITWKSPVGSQG